MPRHPTLRDVERAVEGRAAVTPSLLWSELGGGGDFPPRWVFDHLRRLGYGPVPAGFWWRNDIPSARAQRLVGFINQLDEVYPDDRDESC